MVTSTMICLVLIMKYLFRNVLTYFMYYSKRLLLVLYYRDIQIAKTEPHGSYRGIRYDICILIIK